jgi:hypothetical protein
MKKLLVIAMLLSAAANQAAAFSVEGADSVVASVAADGVLRAEWVAAGETFNFVGAPTINRLEIESYLGSPSNVPPGDDWYNQFRAFYGITTLTIPTVREALANAGIRARENLFTSCGNVGPQVTTWNCYDCWSDHQMWQTTHIGVQYIQYHQYFSGLPPANIFPLPQCGYFPGPEGTPNVINQGPSYSRAGQVSDPVPFPGTCGANDWHWAKVGCKVEVSDGEIQADLLTYLQSSTSPTDEQLFQWMLSDGVPNWDPTTVPVFVADLRHSDFVGGGGEEPPSGTSTLTLFEPPPLPDFVPPPASTGTVTPSGNGDGAFGFEFPCMPMFQNCEGNDQFGSQIMDAEAPAETTVHMSDIILDATQTDFAPLAQKTCPGPMVFHTNNTTLGENIEMEWDIICDTAVMAKPFVMMAAFLIAGFMVIGAGRGANA